ncbi:MAG: hypothetical protein SFU98_07305 [Leptospiraceae bacterium]|nr:hypothetical protein [Leptospiraceae bacterium]
MNLEILDNGFALHGVKETELEIAKLEKEIRDKESTLKVIQERLSEDTEDDSGRYTLLEEEVKLKESISQDKQILSRLQTDLEKAKNPNSNQDEKSKYVGYGFGAAAIILILLMLKK